MTMHLEYSQVGYKWTYRFVPEYFKIWKKFMSYVAYYIVTLGRICNILQLHD